jgi:hypothetical protein
VTSPPASPPLPPVTRLFSPLPSPPQPSAPPPAWQPSEPRRSHPRRPRVQCPALPYKKAAAAPQGSPNPSRHGEFSPFRFASARRRRRRRRRGEEDPEAHRQLAAYLAKPEDRTWELEDAAKPSTATPLLPLLRSAVSFHADDLAPPRFTAAYTSARGHQGEAKLPRPSVVDPAFEPRRFAIAPCRSCRRAAAGDAGHRARLGRFLVQVPPPPSPQTRTRAAVSLSDPAPSSPR